MDLPGIDLNLLVALHALLHERNVTRAGESIGLSQPAMSAALGRLRRHFGDELLTRDGRHYALTRSRRPCSTRARPRCATASTPSRPGRCSTARRRTVRSRWLCPTIGDLGPVGT